MRLAVDRNLGRLARWLRLLGLDVVSLPLLEPPQLLRAAGDRRLLTRVRSLRGRAVVIEADRLEQQLPEALRKLGLRVDLSRLGRRCSRCNAELEEISPAEAAPFVPEHVLHQQRSFRRCPRCHRLYWPGTHWERMRALLVRLLPPDELQGVGDGLQDGR